MFKIKTESEKLSDLQNLYKKLEYYQESALNAASIAFVKMAENGDIDDITASENMQMFSEWSTNTAYTEGALRQFDMALYRCVQAHTSQDDWTPDVTPSLWVLTSDPAEEFPKWSAPIGAHDAYKLGDKVNHNDKNWVSNVDENVWEPGVYGWDEV